MTDSHDLVETFRATPAWFDEAKLGVFIHWTASAIPAYAPLPRTRGLDETAEDNQDWEDQNLADYLRAMPEAELYHAAMDIPDSPTARHHAQHYPSVRFSDFVAEFRDRMIPGWDPAGWAELFAQAGAGYVVFAAMVEDGFLMWPSDHPNPHKTNWQSSRDVVGELADAVRGEGLRFGVYYSGGWDTTFGPPLWDDPPADDTHRQHVDAHWRELIDRYAPSTLWNDYLYSPAGLDLDGLFAHYLARVPDGTVNDRFDMQRQQPFDRHDRASVTLHTDYTTPEYSTDASPARKWEASRGLGRGYGYNRFETEDDYLTETELIHIFVDIVARGGNLLINVGPTGTGQIPWLQAQRLLALGRWLTVNGEAIYATRPWQRHSGTTDHGTQIRYTASDEAVHAIVLGTPPTAQVELDVTLTNDTTVILHGWDGTLRWHTTRHGTLVDLPEVPDHRLPALSLRLAPAATVQPAQ